MRPNLHQLVRNGELEQVRAHLDSHPGDVNARDSRSLTPLMNAVVSATAGIEMMRLLIERGADVHYQVTGDHGLGGNVMSYALGVGDPEKVELLLSSGADIHHVRKEGYSALIDAVHSRDVFRDPRLLDLLRLLINQGVDLNVISNYGESGLRVLSRIGRFDGVKVLLDAGADAAQLAWTPLMRATACGSLDEMQKAFDGGADLEAKDYWERTAWLLAIQTGDVAKTQWLLERGANKAVRGRCDKPAAFYAIETGNAPMLRWLMARGVSLQDRDEFGGTPLTCAVEHNALECVEVLLKAGVDVNEEEDGSEGMTALREVRSRDLALRLLEAGANPRHLPFEGRRALLGFEPEPNEDFMTASSEAFKTWRVPRYGTSNPERIQSPFWEAMIRSGITAYRAAKVFEDDVAEEAHPVWCAQRFGQSITFLHDGRIIQIGGEHEDHYDYDFCIYNDVFVHHPDGRIDIYGYPENVFPPTDFHTATLLGDYIYVIGSLGYSGRRHYGTTQVLRLNTKTFVFEACKTKGDLPGWIYNHSAVAISDREIQVSGGTIVDRMNGQEEHQSNTRVFTLNVEDLRWRAGGTEQPGSK